MGFALRKKSFTSLQLLILASAPFSFLHRNGPMSLKQPLFTLSVPKNLPDATNFLALLMHRSKVTRHVIL